MCWESDVGTFKSCLGYCCLSIREENEEVEGEGVFQTAKTDLSPQSLLALSASAGLAVIANVNMTWPQCVFECTFK